jgi:hypothetical protein
MSLRSLAQLRHFQLSDAQLWDEDLRNAGSIGLR